MSIIYDRIKEVCDIKDITISKLEDECGLANGTIGKWRNTSGAKADSVATIAKHLRVSTDYLLGNSEIPATKEFEETDKGFITVARGYIQSDKATQELLVQFFNRAHPLNPNDK